MSETVYVYTMNGPGKGSWSRYVFEFADPINAFAHLGDDMYIRHGDVVSKVVDSALTDEVVDEGASPTTFTAITDPATAAGAHYGVALSDSVLAIGHATSPYVSIYDRTGNAFSLIASPGTLPAGQVNGVAVSPDGVYVATANFGSPYLTIYKRDGYGAYNKLTDPASLPANFCNQVAFSPDGVYLAVVHADSPYVSVYKRSGDTFTKLAALPDAHATGYGYRLAYDGVHLAVGYTTSPYLKVWRQVGDTFSAVTLNGTATTTYPSGLAFSADHLAITHAASPYLSLYERGASYTRIADPATPPTGNSRSCAFSSDGSLLLVGLNDSPYVAGYTVSGNTFTYFAPAITLGEAAPSIAFLDDLIVFGQTGDAEAFTWGGVLTTTPTEFEGVIHWPWLDFGQPGVDKQLHGFDNIGTGTASIELGYDQSNLSTFTDSWAIPADTLPGTPHPFPICAPTISVKITYDGGQAWLWNATNLYLNDSGGDP